MAIFIPQITATFSADAKEDTTSGIVEELFGENAETLAGIVVFHTDHTKILVLGSKIVLK